MSSRIRRQVRGGKISRTSDDCSPTGARTRRWGCRRRPTRRRGPARQIFGLSSWWRRPDWTAVGPRCGSPSRVGSPKPSACFAPAGPRARTCGRTCGLTRARRLRARKLGRGTGEFDGCYGRWSGGRRDRAGLDEMLHSVVLIEIRRPGVHAFPSHHPGSELGRDKPSVRAPRPRKHPLRRVLDFGVVRSGRNPTQLRTNRRE